VVAVAVDVVVVVVARPARVTTGLLSLRVVGR